MLYPDFQELVSLKSRKLNLSFSTSRAISTSTAGNHNSPFRGQGLDFDSVREYVPGDDIRNIDWRVTARTGSPHLKLFKEDRERQVFICIDLNTRMRFGTKNTFKSIQAAKTAALLGWQAIQSQDSVGACLFGDVPNGIQIFKSGRTKKSFCSMLKQLAEPPTNIQEVSIDDALLSLSKHTPSGSLIYLISDFLEIDDKRLTETTLGRLHMKNDLVFVSINDRADQQIYPVGLLTFFSKEEKRTLNTESLAGRKRYETLWAENRTKLASLTHRFKIPLVQLSTESNLDKELLLALKSLKGGKNK